MNHVPPHTQPPCHAILNYIMLSKSAQRHKKEFIRDNFRYFGYHEAMCEALSYNTPKRKQMLNTSLNSLAFCLFFFFSFCCCINRFYFPIVKAMVQFLKLSFLTKISRRQERPLWYLWWRDSYSWDGPTGPCLKIKIAYNLWLKC